LGLTTHVGQQLTKSLPVCDFMSVPLLIVCDGLTTTCFGFSLQPQVEGVATDVHHPTYVNECVLALDGGDRL
jgi:hypothetical protein